MKSVILSDFGVTPGKKASGWWSVARGRDRSWRDAS
jgi:hypothetical protein